MLVGYRRSRYIVRVALFTESEQSHNATLVVSGAREVWKKRNDAANNLAKSHHSKAVDRYAKANTKSCGHGVRAFRIRRTTFKSMLVDRPDRSTDGKYRFEQTPYLGRECNLGAG
jgi:hypothetical protein